MRSLRPLVLLALLAWVVLAGIWLGLSTLATTFVEWQWSTPAGLRLS